MRPPDRYIRTRADEAAWDSDHYWNQEAGDKVVRFLENYITLSSGPKAYQQLKLFDHQKHDVIYPLYSWRRKDHRRRFTRCLITSGKKSFGKSAVFGAGLSLYHLLCDGVDSPLCVLGAVNREQASEVFKETLFSVKQNKQLRAALHAVESQKQLTYPKKNGVLKAISSDNLGRGKGGWNCSFVCLDEVALHPNASLYEMFKPSMRARAAPLMLLLSNAGYDKGHFYYTEVYRLAKDILSGDCLDTSFLPVVYEVPEEVDWKDRTHWPLGNPGMLHGIISADSLDDDFADAQRSRAAEMHFRRFSLNQWTAAKNSWIDLDLFDQCRGTFPPLDQAPVYIGVDLSSSGTDLTSVAACWPINGKYYVKTWNFTTRHACEQRAKQNLKEYEQFEYGGDLKVIPGNCIDYALVRETIKKVPGKIQLLVFDKWSSRETTQLLMKEGYNVIEFPQSHAWYNEPCKKFETLISEKLLVHSGDQCLLRWAVNNTQLEVNKMGLARPVKGSDMAKIDPLTSLLQALSQAVQHEGKYAVKASVYDTRGPLVFG